MRRISFIFILLFPAIMQDISAQSDLVSPYKIIEGNRGDYSFQVPRYFEKKKPSQKNTDVSVGDDYGASINVNVTDRLPEEYQITAHEYTREMFESQYKSLFPNYEIHSTDKIKLDGINAFLIDVSGTVNSNLRQLSIFLYHEDKAYVITATAESENFDRYIPLFKKTLDSFKIR